MKIQNFDTFLFERNKLDVPYSFEDFLNIVHGNDMYNEVQKMVDWYVKSYGKTEDLGNIIMYTFFGLINNCKSDEELRQFYNAIINAPKERFDIIGNGAEGVIIDYGNYILKYYYSGKLPPHVLRYIENYKAVKPKHLPYLKYHGNGWFVREKYKILTPKIKKFFKLIEKRTNGGPSIYEIAMEGNYDKSNFTKAELQAMQYMEELQQELIATGIKDHDDHELADFVTFNVGEDKNGNIIFTDF